MQGMPEAVLSNGIPDTNGFESMRQSHGWTID
jgi:hypothetical protein